MHGTQDGMIHGMMAGHEASAGAYSPWLDLAAAIVKTAVDDYVKVLRKLWRKSAKPEDIRRKRYLIAEKAELEDFFHSAWYETLTDIDPDKLIYQCKLTAKAKEQAAIESANRKKIRKLLKEAE